MNDRLVSLFIDRYHVDGTDQSTAVANIDGDTLADRPQTQTLTLGTASVIKVGGSLFSLPDLPGCLRKIIKQTTTESQLIVAGGGAVADVVRRFAADHSIDEPAGHMLAVRAMQLQTHFLKEICPELILVESQTAFSRSFVEKDGPFLVAPHDWLANVAEQDLPRHWQVTSDSIAAFIAKQIEAERLVLLKSVGASEPMGLANAVARGWVDEHFPVAATGLQVSWINLREDVETEIVMSRICENGAG